MALFDSLVKEVDARFQLSGKSSSLLTALLNLMIDEKRGGLLGFLDLFRRAGLSDVVETWISEGANAPLSSQQIEDALGANNLSEIAKRVGLPAATATSALAFMIPAAIDGLTPDGVVPNKSSLQAMLSNYIGGSSAAPNANIAASTTQDRLAAGALATATADAGGSGLLRVLLPLLLLGLLGFLAYQFLARPNQDVVRVNANFSRAANADLSVAAVNANAPTVATVDSNANAATGASETNDEIVRAANERARQALNVLTANSTPQKVVAALNFSIINFAKDSAEIPEENKALLQQAANVLKAVPAGTRIEIGGHTDNDGDDAYNQQLSERRANAVRDELVKYGLDGNVLTAKGYGETQARATNETPEGRFQNRRIEYTIVAPVGATTSLSNDPDASRTETINATTDHN